LSILTSDIGFAEIDATKFSPSINKLSIILSRKSIQYPGQYSIKYLHNGEVDSQAVGGTANAFAAAIQDVRVKVPSQIFTFDNIDLSICSTDFCRPLSIAFAPAPFFRCPGR
jgi:hypothetical protein